MDRRRSNLSTRILLFGILGAWPLKSVSAEAKQWTPQIPRTWDQTALADWATPLAGLNARPTTISSEQYYSLAVDNLQTYPVYYPGREPEGYWEMLQHVGPKPLIEPEKLKDTADWIVAGRRVFDEADSPQLRSFDATLIASVRNREVLDQRVAQPLPDGTLDIVRWVPTKQGLALSVPNCRGCHVLYKLDGTRIAGAPRLAEASRTRPFKFRGPAAGYLESANRVLRGAPPFLMGAGPLGAWLYQAYGVPWVKDDGNDRLKNIAEAEYRSLLEAERQGGAITRWNGSPLFPAKIPDLIGFRDRKYIDHTATHLHRGIGDLMRYAALVSFAEVADFGPYHMLAPDTKRIQVRLPDDALYALALYIYSLQPPLNPNPSDARAKAGQSVFTREGCPACHTPPLYTNNKLTLAQGFTPSRYVPAGLDILPLSVGTDPSLALMTRKGTGYYKVPSLKGVWYRGHYLHDGSVASLEEMFDPDRLTSTHVPGGWSPPGIETRAIPGHKFGLNLKPREREQLIAFLRTL
jgi:hypothetical protein